jgi:hypothetical protein
MSAPLQQLRVDASLYNCIHGDVDETTTAFLSGDPSSDTLRALDCVTLSQNGSLVLT